MPLKEAEFPQSLAVRPRRTPRKEVKLVGDLARPEPLAFFKQRQRPNFKFVVRLHFQSKDLKKPIKS
jgi:hypothetical protein